MPRPPCAFCAPAIFPPLSPGSIYSTPSRRPRCQRPQFSTTASNTPATPYAALLVVDLASATEAVDARAAASFAERIAVDRARAPAVSYLLYSTEDAYHDALKRVAECSLPEGDAIAAVGGLYQRGYATPDPYWGRKMWKAWDPKPTRWIISNFFHDSLVERNSESAATDADGSQSGTGASEEQFEMVFDVLEGGGDSSSGAPERLALRNAVAEKLVEMGVAGCVGMKGGSAAGGSIVVRPASADVAEVADFCKMMLKVEGAGSVCAFGRENFVHSFVGSRPDAVGVVVGKGDGEMSDVAGDERVFVSDKVGVAALLEGVIHHAIF